MRKRYSVFFAAAMFLVFLLSFPSFAAGGKWVRDAQGNYAFQTDTGETLSGTYFSSKGAGIVKDGRYSFCYKADGTMKKGLFKNGNDWYFFNRKNGRMAVNRRVRANRKYYYFRDDGIRVKNTWVGRRYYGKNGVQVFGQFVGNRYVDAGGMFVTGEQTINGNLYYFDQATGNMLVNTVKEIGGIRWYFDASGIGRKQTPSGVTVELTYFTDPKVTDASLLAAIIYCEAGNQPYYGQLAVGLVIMNRVRSSEFPGNLKEVIYAAEQFEPCRNTWMTRALKGEIAVSDSCKKAAREVLARYASGNYILETETGQKVNMKGYLFFMTPKAFERLKLKSKHIVLKDHVFFKSWIR